MLAQRFHIRGKSKRGERRKTLCGRLVDSPRDFLVTSSGAHERKKPKLVSLEKMLTSSLVYRCSQCLRHFGLPWYAKPQEAR
jgi:hypothetical protein